jgi:hypothetical protein
MKNSPTPAEAQKSSNAPSPLAQANLLPSATPVKSLTKDSGKRNVAKKGHAVWVIRETAA